MKKLFPCLIVVALMLGLVACAQPDDALPEDVTIQIDRDIYTPIMSSTVGIGLTPVYALERPPETVQLHWRTDYGYFVAWDPPNFKVYLLGTEVINNGEKIYWSYDPDEMGTEKPSVEISLQIEDAQSGQVLAEASLKIGWEDQHRARVISHMKAPLEDKGWVLESYGEQGNLQSVLEGTEIMAIFDSSQGQVHGSAGCNTYYADYMLNNNNVSFLQIAHTEMACLEPEGVMQQEEQYLEVLQDAESYQIQNGKLQINCGAQILAFAAQKE